MIEPLLLNLGSRDVLPAEEERHLRAMSGALRQITALHVAGDFVEQALRREGVFTWEYRTITIVDWERLQEIAEFDPGYPSISREPR
ncbi:hypothetical protein HLI17_33390 [Rhizobium laguerreae]|uniref:Uncharacterized protein n=1 Tax=Rhizobium laguerreae TaxID=1076926 RepID=A0A7Y2RC11_9HYPH|nr:hypothetical protein [Rhizobium laguerreae]NNH68077.1 hypothetical protein [Rhizobium laguerreae]